jgi:cytoskeletal protein CcmA (bactofilin family)
MEIILFIPRKEVGMKPILRISTIFMLLILLFVPFHSAAANGLTGGQVIFGSNYTVKSGETLSGDLLVFGGSVTVEAEARVTGNIFLFGGSLTIAGKVNGDVVLIGGSGSLESTAVIEGNLETVGGGVESKSGAQVLGETNNFTSPPSISYDIPTQITPPEIPQVPGNVSQYINSAINFDPFTNAAWLFFQSLGWAALAALVTLFFDNQTRRVSRAVLHQPVVGGSIGLLTLLVAAVLAVILSITLILIPVALIGLLALAIAFVLGWVAIGLEVGQRMSRVFHQEWALPLSAALGTFLLNIVVNGVGFIPCIGWLAPALVGLLGLGAVVLSRFGMQAYPLGEILPVEAPAQEPPVSSDPTP